MSAGLSASLTWVRTTPPFLRQAGHVHDAGALALEVGGHAEDRAERDDAGAAGAGEDHRDTA